MKRIVASMGLVALGTSALSAADASALSAMQATKPWTAGVSLRGFYDDNVGNSGGSKQGSGGFEVNPFVGVGVAGVSSSANLNYTYSGKYYDKRPAGSSSNWDHTHIFDAAVQHAFSPRLQLSVRDSFVVGQEPDILRSPDSQTFVAFQRISGDNFRNYGSITLNMEVTQLLGFEVGYGNGWYDYADEGAPLGSLPVVGVPVGMLGVVAGSVDATGDLSASRSGALDRIEHSGHVDSRWHFAPKTTGIVGYMYSQTLYNSGEAIGGNVFLPPSASNPVYASFRNVRSHTGYLGLEHSFNSDLSGSIRGEASYNSYYNDPAGSTDVSPYAALSLRYFYGPESRVEIGFTQNRVTSDLTSGSTSTDFVHGSDASTVYGSITHRIVPNLFGTLLGTFQNSVYDGGGPTFDGKSDRFFLLGLDFSYRFNPHLSAHAGYNYDRLDSDIPGREFSRNRFYAGVTAQY